MFLVLMHIGITYKVNNFVNYYPIEKNYLNDLLQLESLPSLLIQDENSLKFFWVSAISMKEFKVLLKY